VQDIVAGFKSLYSQDQETELSLEEYLNLVRTDPMAYASPAERMLAAIGEPELIDTRNDPRLSRLFSNRVSINIIPHTQAVTTLRSVKAGDRVNLEVDTIARYVERMLSVRTVV